MNRLQRYEDFKAFKYRIIVSTDLFGRGIDIERINVVFNYDMPTNSDQYLHRVPKFNLNQNRWEELADLEPKDWPYLLLATRRMSRSWKIFRRDLKLKLKPYPRLWMYPNTVTN